MNAKIAAIENLFAVDECGSFANRKWQTAQIEEANSRRSRSKSFIFGKLEPHPYIAIQCFANLRRFLQKIPDSEKSQIGKCISKKWSLSKKTFSVSLLV